VLNVELVSALHEVESTMDSHAAELQRTFTLRARRSPKRRSSFDESQTSRSVALPILIAHFSQHRRFSTPSKRRKISISNPSTPSDGAGQSSSPPYVHRMSPSPSASVSTVALDAGVTVAMLRALTRDVKAKYGGSPLVKE
jgi:hypothetical protein